MDSQHPAKSNASLRHQRHLRGWSLQHVADQLCKLAEDEDRIPGVTADMVGKWERGEKKASPFYREKLCTLYNVSADILGFIEPLPVFEEPTSTTPVPTQIGAIHQFAVNQHLNPNLVAESQVIYSLLGEGNELSESLITNLLSSGSKQLAILTAYGWTPQDIIAALQILLHGESVMTKINRRQVLQFGAGLFLGNITSPYHEHPSAEERTQLSDAIGNSIAASWTLFQNTNTAQVLTVGQAQLTLLQQAHHALYPSVRPMHYSAVYRLIGGALHFQERYDEARHAHEKSYIAALEGGDVWNMAQSLNWQADGLKAQEQYSAALDVIEGALRLLSQQNTQETMRLRAHLLASGAENAAYLGDAKRVEENLNTSESLLKDLPAHEEFDYASWHQHAGACALILGQYDTAIKHLQQAMSELPSHWTLRHATTLMPLALVYARKQERETSLAIAKQAIPVISTINSPGLSKQFVGYIQKELTASFPNDAQVQAFVTHTQQQLLPTKATITSN